MWAGLPTWDPIYMRVTSHNSRRELMLFAGYLFSKGREEELSQMFLVLRRIQNSSKIYQISLLPCLAVQ